MMTASKSMMIPLRMPMMIIELMFIPFMSKDCLLLKLSMIEEEENLHSFITGLQDPSVRQVEILSTVPSEIVSQSDIYYFYFTVITTI